jgi:hypothetical protein
MKFQESNTLHSSLDHARLSPAHSPFTSINLDNVFSLDQGPYMTGRGPDNSDPEILYV